ncbi:PAS domain-containing sensor histidine kinase [Adhaeribacter aquaticus]|uniref:PAS domain-containing sensor histidine kinase n=1 Tax=Adhaeribacter aquaticus TaxID=299567 RepID=UPI0006849D17|nr:HAMP domain-containing sensor histidine kinase [Adhaeribacter aquaticus]
MNNMNSPLDSLNILEAENEVLRNENKQLRADMAATIFKLEKQIAIEKKYEESQSRFETIFYKSKHGNKIIAPDLRIIQINEVFRDMLGYTEEEIIGTKVIAFAHPDFINHWHELQENLWTKQIPSFQIDTCLVRKDGSTLWVQVTSIIFRDNNISLGYTIVEDISQRKTLELNLKELYDNQETLMHMVAHDLKNPLYNIKAASEFLKEDIAEIPVLQNVNKQESLNLIQIISDVSDQALDIIRDLLIIGELEKSYNTLEKTDLRNFIQSQLAKLKVRAQKKDIDITFLSPEEPVFAAIHQSKFIRVLENLISNAVKFTNKGGQVTISLKSKDQSAVLQITDNGIGIPEKLLPTIFNKFTRANRNGTERETTTGLGLYIVKLIVEKHHGKIWVESKENEGTSFFVELKQA